MQQCQSEQEFRDKMLEGMQDLRTKMNALVGEDGTDGRISVIEERVTDLEISRGRQKGFMAAIATLTAIGGAVGEWLTKR